MDDSDDETEPLVRSHQIQVSTEDPVSVNEVEYNVHEEDPPPYSSYDEKTGKPPPYYHARPTTPTPSEGSSVASSLIPHINCRVCQTVLSVEGKLHLHVIKCHSCGEATPIRPAPTGKKYVRCPCNCLLICKATSQRIVCPRPNCKRVISLGPVSISNLGREGERNPANPARRIVCAHCNTSFLWVRPVDTCDACPHCGEYSSFGNGYKRRKMKIFSVLGIIALAIAVCVMSVILFDLDQHQIYEYVIFSTLYLVAFVMFVFVIRYAFMSVSRVEQPYYQQYT